MPGQTVTIILDKVYNKSVPKPNNLRPGYDLKYVHNVQTYNDNYRIEKVVEIERRYDYLSIIRPHETPQQWAFHVRDALQELLSKREYSLYHVYSLFASFGQGKNKTFYDYDIDGLRDIPREYRRPSVHKSQMAICFKCWKLIKIAEVEQRKVYYDGWRRWAYEVKSEDLMKNHWDYSCFKTKTATITKNTIPSVKQEIFSPTSYRSSNCKSNISRLFISSLYIKQNNLNHLNQPKCTVLRLRDRTEITIV
jgi:hypothetical protein